MTKEKCFQFHNSTVYVGTFDSLDDFLFYVRDENVNYMFVDKMASKSRDYYFTETNSYEEAWNLCRYGMNEGFIQFADQFDSLNYYIDSQDRVEDYYSVSGFLPSVPRYLLNIPAAMHSYHVVKDDPTINIYMNYSYEAYTSKNAVKNRGIIVLSLIQYLEKKGYKINFYGFDLSHTKSYSELLFLEVPLKKEYEKINLKLMYFPLVNLSFLRRLLFRAEEKMPLKSSEWVGGYGIPSRCEETIEFLEAYQKLKNIDQIIYISSPDELGIYGKDLKEDYQRAIKKINQKYQNIDIQKRKNMVNYG